MRGQRDLRILVALAVLCAILAPLLPVRMLSLLFGLPLALFLPGYALTLAIFARRPIELPQRLLLGLGLSLSVLALGALLLNYVPGGIGPVSWAVLLVVVVLYGCRAAAVRRPRTGYRRGRRSSSRPSLTGVNAALVTAGLACVVAALAIAFTTSSATHADGYTALWLLPPSQHQADAGGVQIGVNSQEQAPTGYLLRVRVADRPGEIVRRFSLDPGETRVLRLRPRPSTGPAAAVPVRAMLYLQSEPDDVYRRVSGWLTEPTTSP